MPTGHKLRDPGMQTASEEQIRPSFNNNDYLHRERQTRSSNGRTSDIKSITSIESSERIVPADRLVEVSADAFGVRISGGN